MKKLSILLAFTVIFLGGVLGNMPLEASADENSYIEVTTTTEGGDTVKGNAMVSAVPASGKAVEKVTFYAKAVNEPDENYYPYAPDSEAPYTWSWSTGAPWVPDGEYVLKMVIDYTSGETETITRNIFTKNDREPNSPDSPSALNASARTNNSVTLTWEPSASQKKFDYVIYQDGTKIGTTAENTFTIEQLSPGSTYSFRVKTRDIYNNVSIDDNSINVLIPSESSDPLPDLSSIQAEGPAGATPGGSGYSGNVNLSVSATDNDQIAKVEFFVKTYSADESAYWKFPAVQKNGDNYSVNWQTTSAPDGNVIIKAAAYDSAGQARTITKVLLVDNEDDGGPEEPAWEPAETPPANRIIGYLAGWSTYNGFEIMNDLDASRLTHINYAFALIGTDLKVKMSDPEQDPKNFAELSKLKAKYPHLKSVIAIGGWGGSANFIEAASTEESREIFADSAVEFMLENGFDGVDLDWEYPVTGGGPGTYPNPDDRENYPLLLKELREKLDEQGEKDDKHYILSIAGGATAGFANNTQLGLSQQYLDYVQIMTYDIHGTWEQKADFNAPLLDDNGKTYSVDKGVQAYLDAGVPPEKLVMGVPFYGYKYNVTSGENNGLRQPFEGSGSITYDRVMKDGAGKRL
ncbi:Chitinase [Bacillus sp. ZZV12-4809]|nr:Chitinase [Bacillus sp. ZZV12-4809]